MHLRRKLCFEISVFEEKYSYLLKKLVVTNRHSLFDAQIYLIFNSERFNCTFRDKIFSVSFLSFAEQVEDADISLKQTF